MQNVNALLPSIVEEHLANLLALHLNYLQFKQLINMVKDTTNTRQPVVHKLNRHKPVACTAAVALRRIQL